VTDRRLLLVHAHPDDETIATGATMARYAAEGVSVTLVTCTLGELGEVLVPELAGLAADRADQLGGYRISELAAAMRELGIADHRFLGGAGRWRDSGMIDTAGNDDPRAFWACGTDEMLFDEAVSHLVEVIDEVQPQVLVTYDENGGYGHPDHIMAHRVAMAAVDRASWQVPRVYWHVIPKSFLQRGIDALIASGQGGFEGMTSADEFPFGAEDHEVTTALINAGFGPTKTAAMRSYPTQISPESSFFALINSLGEDAFAVEHYRLVRGEQATERGADGRETELFGDSPNQISGGGSRDRASA
jgi:N-acetyl-1-D-myo-inositol-2-amino-2-deoxy-alpha-D-glucopyranoside deacetylase